MITIIEPDSTTGQVRRQYSRLSLVPSADYPILYLYREDGEFAFVAATDHQTTETVRQVFDYLQRERCGTISSLSRWSLDSMSAQDSFALALVNSTGGVE